MFDMIRPYQFTHRGDQIGWLKGVDKQMVSNLIY